MEMCSVGISVGRSKLCQSSSDFMLKPKLKPAAINLFSRQTCPGFVYTGFVQTQVTFRAMHCHAMPISTRAPVNITYFREF